MRRPAGHQAARLPLPLLLALRLLKSARRDSFATFLSVVAAGGMALGVAALLLSLGALSGFQAELKAEILARTPEIAISVSGRARAAEVSELVWRTAAVEQVQLTLSGLGWLVARGGVQPVELVGFEGELPVQFPEPSGIDAGLYLPESLASSWLLEPGEIVEVASSRSTLTPIGPQPRVRRLPLSGTFAGGRVEHRLRAALPLAEAEALLGDRYQVLISTGNLDRAVELAERLREGLPEGAVVETWRDLNRALFFALRLEKAAMFLAVALIVLVAALALVSDVSLIIANKRREVGMLRALGLRRKTLMLSFFVFGSGLALTGIGVGAAVGIGLAVVLDRNRLLRLPERVYFLDYVPFTVDPVDVGAVLLAALVVAVAATLYAARGAAQLDPVEALRQ